LAGLAGLAGLAVWLVGLVGWAAWAGLAGWVAGRGLLCCTSPLYRGEGNQHGICSSRARRSEVSVTWQLPRRRLCRRVASGGVGWSCGVGGVGAAFVVTSERVCDLNSTW
jgi:hypothetical protein